MFLLLEQKVPVSLRLFMKHTGMVKHVCARHSTLDVSPSSNHCPTSDVSASNLAYCIVWPAVASALASVVSSDHFIATTNQRA